MVNFWFLYEKIQNLSIFKKRSEWKGSKKETDQTSGDIVSEYRDTMLGGVVVRGESEWIERKIEIKKKIRNKK